MQGNLSDKAWESITGNGSLCVYYAFPIIR